MKLTDMINESATEKKEMKAIMDKVKKAEDKARKALQELDDLYDTYDSDFSNTFGWQSAPKGNQGEHISELLSSMSDKNSFYNRKLSEMK